MLPTACDSQDLLADSAECRRSGHNAPVSDHLTPAGLLATDIEFDRERLIPHATFDHYGAGVYRRRIRMVNHRTASDGQTGRTTGELEDDFHHFRVEIIHDGSNIVEANGTGLRGPWVTCMEADRPLREIEGHPLTASSTGIGAYTAPTMNCTHLFDLTGLTVAHTQRDVAERVYDFAVADVQDSEGTRELAAWRDGEQVLRWTASTAEVFEPPEWRDAPLAVKFIPWAAQNLDPETAEVAIALRRVIAISHGRVMDLDTTPTAADLGAGPNGRCHSFQPEVAVKAIRNKKSAFDFADHSEHMLSDMAVRDA